MAELPSDTTPHLATDLTAHASSPGNLPLQATSFIGREAELRVALDLLARARLVTLTGPGGTGKSRFALRLAAAAADRFPHGTFFVGLAPVFAPDLVIPTIGQVLGAPDTRGRPPIESLKDFLCGRRLLLVLDNMEQVLAAGPDLTELLATCAGLTLLVTSRIALRLSGEHELPVLPLALPDPGRSASAAAPTLPMVMGSEAVQLFVERARAVVSGFEVTDQNASAVVELCRRLDGLPLAIELAAARVRLLGPEAMLARLSSQSGRVTKPAGPSAPPAGSATHVSPLQFLTGGARDLPVRQQTLRDTIGWSYGLLTPPEQTLFRRLSIFVGGCTLDDAEALGAADVGDRRWALAPDEILDGVESLIAKSLLRRLDPSAPRPHAALALCRPRPAESRYVMLETIREYGLEELAKAGELLALRRWHAAHFLALAEAAEPGQRGPEQAAWLDRLDAEHDNLRAALEWSLADVTADRQVPLRLAGALSDFWICRGHANEGRGWLDRALAGASGPPAALVKAHYGAGRLAHFQRDSAVASRHLQTALSLARDQGDAWAESWVLHLLGRVAYFDGDAATAERLGQQSLTIARRIGDDWLVGWALHVLALAAHIDGDYARARARYEESIAVRRPIGYREGIGVCLYLLGLVLYSEGNYARARQRLCESLPIMRDVSYYGVPSVLAAAASIAARLGQPKRAARLAGATASFSVAVDADPIPLAEAMLTQALDLARQAIGDAAYAAAWADGRALSLEAAIDEVMVDEASADGSPGTPGESAAGALLRPADAASPPQPVPTPLTYREAAVLSLIAAGRTTREIAATLCVSVPTVERHITHLYGKIGARGRADATAYALRHGLAAAPPSERIP